MKRAQELRVDEISVQNLRERHDTIQRVTTRSSSRNSPLRTTKRTKISSTGDRVGDFFTRDDKQYTLTLMQTFAGRPSTSSSLIPADIPQNSMVGQQRQQISKLQFDKFTNPQSFLLWKIRFKNQVTTCSEFPSEAMLWIKEVEMVDSFEELKSSRTVIGKIFSLLRCWT